MATIEEVCAFQYNAINRAILDARDLVPKNQWVEVFYEDLVRDPVGSFRDTFHRCDLGFDARLKRHTQNVLLTPYNAFSEIRVNKWEGSHHCEKIQRILPQVQETALLMGYTR